MHIEMITGAEGDPEYAPGQGLKYHGMIGRSNIVPHGCWTPRVHHSVSRSALIQDLLEGRIDRGVLVAIVEGVMRDLAALDAAVVEAKTVVARR